MTENLFIRTQNLNWENLFTEVLGFLLSHQRYEHFQRLFYHKILGEIVRDTKIRVDTQCNFAGFGRPDIVIEGTDFLIIIEAKLGADLDYMNQFEPYANIIAGSNLSKFFPDRSKSLRKYLVALAPTWTIRQTEAQCTRQCGTTIAEQLEKLDVHYVPFTINEISDMLSSADIIMDQLKQFIAANTEKELTMEEVEVLKNVLVGQTIQKTQEKITTVYSSLDVKKYPVDRISSGYDFYGFYTYVNKNLKVWFGYSVTAWAEYGSPLIIQHNPKWTDAEKLDASKLRKLGFHNADAVGFGFVKIVNPAAADWLIELTKLVESLRR